jgi:hypothetical protein
MFVPSHWPPHVVPAPVQSVRGARGVPRTAMHVPAWPGSLHAWHCPVHGESQQTPSAHDEPAAHCPFDVQASPRFARGAHVPDAQ